MTDRRAQPRYGRRRLLAAAAVAGLAAAIGFGIDDLVASPGTTAPPAPTPEPASGPAEMPLVSGSFRSRRRGTEVGWTVSHPPGWHKGDRIPLCLVLHGYDADHTYAFAQLHLQDVQAVLAHRKQPLPMVLAAADGGNGYWHPHDDRDDPQGMLMDEFLPRLAPMGISIDRMVAFGWSMGGYGALLLAETFPGRITKVGVESPAIWPSYADSERANATAFDSAADWSDHDVIGHLQRLGSVPVRVNCGLSDPFLPASRRLAGRLEPGDVALTPGGHDLDFWRAHAPGQLQFLAS